MRFDVQGVTPYYYPTKSPTDISTTFSDSWMAELKRKIDECLDVDVVAFRNLVFNDSSDPTDKFMRVATVLDANSCLTCYLFHSDENKMNRD